jgi:peroxidase
MYTLLLYCQRTYSHNKLPFFHRLFERDGTDNRESYQLSDSFDDPSRLFGANFMDNALRGLLNVPADCRGSG